MRSEYAINPSQYSNVNGSETTMFYLNHPMLVAKKRNTLRPHTQNENTFSVLPVVCPTKADILFIMLHSSINYQEEV